MLRETIARKIPLFRDASDEQMQEIVSKCDYLPDYARGECVFEVGQRVDAVYFPVSRELVRHSSGARVLVELSAIAPAKSLRFDRVVENDIFGEFEFLCGGMRPSSAGNVPLKRETRAVMLATCPLVRMPLDVLARLLDVNPVMRQRFVALAAGRMHSAMSNQVRRRHLDLDPTLAEHLLDMATDYATTFDTYAVFTTRVSQEEIANDLGISRRALTDRFSTWVEAGLLRTTPLTLLDIRRLEQIQRIGREAPTSLVQSIYEVATQHLSEGELSLARSMSLDFLRHFPAAPQLSYVAALAAARSGSTAAALQILDTAGLILPDSKKLQDRILFGLLHPAASSNEAIPSRERLVEDALSDEDVDARSEIALRSRMMRDIAFLAGEILALRARLAKDDKSDDTTGIQARLARDLYLAAWEDSGRRSHYPLVNAATMALIGGDRDGAKRLAAMVLPITGDDDYWTSASRVEALLLLGETAAATESLGNALACDPDDGQIASTRRQLVRVRPLLGEACNAVLERLTPRRPLVYSGSMINRNNLNADPDVVESAMREKAAFFFAENKIGAVYGALARGSDIVIAEAALEAGCPLHVVLPFDIAPFVEISVAYTGEAGDQTWRRRFEYLLSAARSVTIAQPGKPAARDLDISFRHGFRAAAAMAIERAGELAVDPLLLALTISGGSDGIAGSNSDIADWLSNGHHLEHIQLPFSKLRQPGRERTLHGFTPMIFCFPTEQDDPVRFVADAITSAGDNFDAIYERRMKDGRIGSAIAFADCEAAVRFAFLLDELRKGHRLRFRGRIICDYGPAKDRHGRVDDNLLARLTAGADFPSFPDDGVLATPSFARELQFAGLSGISAISIGQRLHQIGNSDRMKVSAGQSVYRLVRTR